MRDAVYFEFHPENPTGHYDLDLTVEEDADVANEIFKMAKAQSTLEARLNNYYRGRFGGPRELPDRCWRNATLDGRPFTSVGLKALPNYGLLSLDFVKLARHGKSVIQMEELALDET